MIAKICYGVGAALFVLAGVHVQVQNLEIGWFGLFSVAVGLIVAPN